MNASKVIPEKLVDVGMTTKFSGITLITFIIAGVKFQLKLLSELFFAPY